MAGRCRRPSRQHGARGPDLWRLGAPATGSRLKLHPRVVALEEEIRAFRPRVIQSEDEPELTDEQVSLYALEAKLADVRRILVHAGSTRAEAFRSDVRALGSLVEELHHQVLEQAQLGGRR